MSLPRAAARLATGSLALTAALAACADDPAGPARDEAPVASTEDAVVVDSATQLTWVRRVHDRVVDGAGGPALEVTIHADGAGTARMVGVHASVDGGPWQDVAATRVAGRNTATDVWTATVTRPGGFSSIEYVVWGQPAGAARRWDSRGGANYRTAARRPVAWAGHRRDGAALIVDLDVENRAYDKQCAAIYTGDDWMRSQYTAAGSYVGPTGRAGIERWQVRIEDAPMSGVTVDRAAVVEYAVTCSFGGGAAFWDSNLGGNFREERAAAPVTAWSTPFAAALDVEVAPDGTVFALSTSDPPSGAAPGSRRWVTVYGPDGAWRGVVTLPADAERITHVASAGVLIAEVWTADGNQVRRVAIDHDGDVAWDHTAARGSIVATSGAAFLVANGAVARLGAAAPALVPCVEPVVSPSGIAACLDAEGGATVVVDVDTGATVATLPLGEPYAISDDGAVVVIGASDPMAGSYLTELVAYRLDGAVAWRRDGLALVPDHAWGGPRTAGDCTNHAFADVLGFTDQPGSPEAGEPRVRLLDVTTGAELRSEPIAGGSVQACPAEDGRFYWNPSYMRYGKWAYALGVDDAEIDYLDVGLNGQVAGHADGGRVAYVQKPYVAWSGTAPQPRLVVRDPGRERFSDYVEVPAGASAPLVDAAGDHVVVVVGGALTRLAL